MTANDILATLPYYNAPEIQELTPTSVKEFIENCNRNSLSGVLGIFPETTTASECDHVIHDHVICNHMMYVQFVVCINFTNSFVYTVTVVLTAIDYQKFLAVASRYHGSRLFGVLKTSTAPEGLPVEVTTLPAVILVGGAAKLVTDLDKLEYALITANELTPSTLPYFLSANKPLMLLVVPSSNSLVETTATLYPVVAWLDQ